MTVKDRTLRSAAKGTILAERQKGKTMAFNIFEKTWNNEGKASFAAYEKEDEDEAFGLYHQKCATNRKDKNCPRYLVTLSTDEGAQMQNEYRVKPVTEPETTTEA